MQIDDKLPATDRIAEWMEKSGNDRRRSSNSSSDLDLLRRSSIASSVGTTQSLGESDAQARKRKLEGNVISFPFLKGSKTNQIFLSLGLN